MYKRKKLIEEIEKNLAYISIVIEYSNKINLYDLNIYSEYFFCEVLNLIYPFKLEDLNNKQKNFPVIDLADYKNKLCFQITSTNEKSKILKTIENFEKKKYYNDFSKLYVLLLKMKKDNYGTFKKSTYFSKDHILDYTDLIIEIKKNNTDNIIKIHNYIENNISKFENIDNPKKLINDTYTIFNNINIILINLKKSALLQYELSNEKINTILNKLTFKQIDLDQDDFQFLIRVSQFINTISENDIFELSKYISLREDTKNKYFSNQLINDFDYITLNVQFLDRYTYEQIERLLNDVKKILDLEVNNVISSSYGEVQKINSESIIISVSSNDNTDNKLIVLDSENHYIQQHEICLGGVSEGIFNIKTFFQNRYVLAQSNYHIYLWDSHISYNPISILINPNNIQINDYQIYKIKNNIQIITLNENNQITIWKIINYIPFVYKFFSLNENSDVLIQIHNENKLLKYSRYSKSIYLYDIDKEEVSLFFELSSKYNKIIDLTIHPKKNYIAFTHTSKNKFDFDELIQYDIDLNIEFFHVTFENHFLIDCEYKYINNNIQLLVYDRDAAGSNFCAIVRAWIEQENHNFLYCDSNDFAQDFNEFYESLNFFNHYLYLIKSSCSNRIYKIKSNSESLFYETDKNYYIKELYTQ